MKLPIVDILCLLILLAAFIFIVGSIIRYIKVEIDYKKWKDGDGR